MTFQLLIGYRRSRGDDGMSRYQTNIQLRGTFAMSIIIIPEDDGRAARCSGVLCAYYNDIKRQRRSGNDNNNNNNNSPLGPIQISTLQLWTPPIHTCMQRVVAGAMKSRYQGTIAIVSEGCLLERSEREPRRIDNMSSFLSALYSHFKLTLYTIESWSSRD